MMGGARDRAIAGGPVIWRRGGRKEVSCEGRFRLLPSSAGQALVNEISGSPRDAFTIFKCAFVDDHRPPLVIGTL